MIELEQGVKEVIADILNVLPEVRWDRVAGTPERFLVFGWVDREKDLRSDFVALTVEPGLGELSYYLTTSSAERSTEFMQRIDDHHGVSAEEREHFPCQRVENIFGDLVPGAIVAATTDDPMAAGGDIVAPDGAHGKDTAVINLERAVVVSAVMVSAFQLQREGQLEELAIGLLIAGDINQSEPREQARVLNVLGLEDVAGVICELQAMAHRYSPMLGAELTRLLEKRWAELEAEGLTKP